MAVLTLGLGIGAVTAAVLTAFIGDIGRFENPGKLVTYFGVLPIEMSSGVDRDGTGRVVGAWKGRRAARA